MTDNENLIEEAAKAIYFRADEIGLNLNVGPVQATALARAALAVFEKVHTPTDDERVLSTVIEDAIERWGDEYPTPQVATYVSAAVRDAGFRRPEKPSSPLSAHVEGIQYADDIAEGGDPVPEDYERHYCEEDGEDWPCAAVRSIDAHTDDPGGRAFRSRTYRLLATRDFTGHMDEGRRTAFYEGWSAREQWESTRPRPPQGEPSDAQVLAAVDAFMASQLESEDGPSLVHKNMAAALRAASAVTEQGEE